MEKRRAIKMAMGVAVSLAMAGILHQYMLSLVHHEECSHKLHRIGMALHIYATEHQGRFPKTLQSLVEDGAFSSDTLICPEKDGAGHAQMQFFQSGKLEADIGREDFVASDPAWGPQRYGSVLIGDGTVIGVAPGELAQSIANFPMPATTQRREDK